MYDYDSLPDNIQIEIAELIKNDNLESSNKFYKIPVPYKKTFYTTYGKRILDIIISSVALVIFLPVNCFLGIATLCDVGIPVFFKQKRLGKNNNYFTMIKFRNMTNETDENGILLRAEQRVTKWGKFVRKTSLDELLNFISVFKGDMSIIGPRPLPLVYKGRFNRYHESRHKVRPGLDCPLRDCSKLMTWKNRLENDAWYAENISFTVDLKLMYLLLKEVFFGKDKKARSDGFAEGTFMGYFKNGEIMDSNHIPDKYYRKVLSNIK